MANLQFPHHHIIVDWQKQYANCRILDVDF